MTAAPGAGAGPGAETPTPPVVIAHLSDLHLGAHAPDVVESLLADVAAATPTLTVVTGDLTMRARNRQFVAACALLEGLPVPRLVVLGNHDVPLDPVRRFAQPYRAYQRHLPGPLDRVVETVGVRALGLASMPRWRWKSGRISSEQAELVARVLGSAPAGVVRVLALHHPVSVRGPRGLVGRSRLLEAMDGRVDLVLAGHTHVPSARRVDRPGEPASGGVVEVVAGTATSTRLRGVERSWSVIRVEAGTITVEERREHGNRWTAAGLRRFPRFGDAVDVIPPG